MNKKPQIKNLTDKDFDACVINASRLVLVKFCADWSGPCHIMLPILEDLARKYSGEIKFYRFDVEGVPEIEKKFEIQTIPTLLIFKNGQILDQASGIVSKSELDKKLRKLVD